MPIEIPDICELHSLLLEISGQFLTTEKLSDGFCQGPGTQKSIECRGRSLYPWQNPGESYNDL